MITQFKAKIENEDKLLNSEMISSHKNKDRMLKLATPSEDLRTEKTTPDLQFIIDKDAAA